MLRQVNGSYQYALDSQGHPVPAANGEPGRTYKCIGCGEPMCWTRTADQAWFSHVHIPSGCAPETALRRLARRALCEGIEGALASGRPYRFAWQCLDCGHKNHGDLARSPRRIQEGVTFNGVAVDLLLVAAGGGPLAAVVVTADLGRELLGGCRSLPFPVILIEATWSSIPLLAHGLVVLKAGAVNGPCSGPNHPLRARPDTTCPGCGSAMQAVRFEVWAGYTCYRCHAPMLTVDCPDGEIVGHGRQAGGLAGAAAHVTRDLGVRIRPRFSQAPAGASLAHVCPRCGAAQDDFYVHLLRGGDWTSVSDHPVRLGFYWHCAECDHWLRREIREWRGA